MSASTQAAPLASIVMLAYNHGPYIREAIQSILDQRTSFPFELIIGEDCSTDNTRKIALEYERAHPGVVRVLASEMNVGMLENLRRCDAACRGEFVSYCEGDDYWHSPHKLQWQLDFLQKHPDYAMAHTDFRMHHVESGKIEPKGFGVAPSLDDGDAFAEILSGSRLVLTLTVCIRRSVLDPILRDCPECYSPRFLMGDTQRWLELARRGKVKYLPEVTATHRILVESATKSKNSDRVLRFALSAKDVLGYYIEKYGCRSETKKAAVMRSADHIMKCAFDAKNLAAAKAALNDYRKVGAAVPLASYFYYYGLRWSGVSASVRPAVSAIDLWQKIRRRLA